MCEYAGGVPLRLNDLGPVVMVSGVISLVVGTLMISISGVDPRHEEQLRLYRPEPEQISMRTLPFSGSPKSFSCPKCGYENLTGGFFCAACNSSLWPVGRPSGPSPERSVVERKVRRVIAIRSAKRNIKLVILLVLIALVVSSPFAATFVAGYMAVNSSTLIASVTFYPPMPQANHMILIAWILYSNTSGNALSTSSPTYKITLNGIELPYTDCPPLPNVLGKPV